MADEAVFSVKKHKFKKNTSEMLDPKRKCLNFGLRYNVDHADLSTVNIFTVFKESGEEVTVPDDAGVEPPEVSPVSAKRKKAGRRSSGVWRYFSDIPTGMLAKYNQACRFAVNFALSGF
jgi:hypothetical protein